MLHRVGQVVCRMCLLPGCVGRAQQVLRVYLLKTAVVCKQKYTYIDSVTGGENLKDTAVIYGLQQKRFKLIHCVAEWIS